MTWGDMNKLVCEVAGSKPPRLCLPNWATTLSARLITGIADLCTEPECDAWVVFAQGPHLEQVFVLDRRLSLVVALELMGSVVDPTGGGDLRLAPVLMFRLGLEVNL